MIFQELQEIPEFELGNLVGLVNKEEATEQVSSHTIKAPKSREESVLGIYVKSHAKAISLIYVKSLSFKELCGFLLCSFSKYLFPL